MFKPKTKLNRFIKNLRESRKLSFETLSFRSGLSMDELRRLERSNFTLKFVTAHKLADGLRCNVSCFKPFYFAVKEKKQKTGNKFGIFVREHRKKRGLSQEVLASQMGISKNAVSLVELGVIKMIRGEHLASLASALNVDATKLKAKTDKGKVAKRKRSTSLGQSLTDRRLELGLSQTKLAKEAGTRLEYINNLENGRNIGVPRLKRALQKVIPVLQCKFPPNLYI